MDEDRNGEKIAIQMQLNHLHDEWMISVTKGDLEASDRLWHEMDVVYQYANLTMGWCINCHRDTQVNTKGNDYYDKLVALHKKTSKSPLKVEDVGGLECSKCHY